MKSFILISALCMCWALAAKTEKKQVSQEGKKLEKRGLYDFGTYTNDHDFAGLKISSGYDFTNSNGGKGAPYSGNLPVPQAYTAQTNAPYQLKYEVPVSQPYIVTADKPYTVNVPKAYPVTFKKPETVEKSVPVRIPYPVDVAKPVNLPVPSTYITEKKPYPVYTKVPVAVENQVPVHVPIKTSSRESEGNGHVEREQQWRPIIKAQNDAGNKYVDLEGNNHLSVLQNHQQLDLTQLKHQLVPDYGTGKLNLQTSFPGQAQTFGSGYLQFSSGKDANKENIQQWQYLIPGYNKQEQLFSNGNIKFVSPEPNKADYTLNSDLSTGKVQSHDGLTQFGQQIQNNFKEFGQTQPAFTGSNGHQQQQLFYFSQQPQQSYDHLIQWQGQQGHQGYTYNVPEQTNSQQVESGNAQHQHQQLSFGKLAQLGLQTDEKPQQQHTSYGTVKPQQLQIDYESYGKAFAQQAQALIQQQTVHLGAEGHQQKYQIQAQQPSYGSYTVGQEAGSYTHQDIGQSGTSSGQGQHNYIIQAQEQSTGSSSRQAAKHGGSSFNHEKSYKALEHQPTYKSSGHENIGFYSNEITKTGGHSFNNQAQKTSGSSSHQAVKQAGPSYNSYKALEQQPTHTPYAGSSSHENIGQIGFYSHEITKPGLNSFNNQPSPPSSHQGIEQSGSSYSYENSYKPLEQQPTYSSHAGSSSHENIEQSGFYSHETTKPGQQSFNNQPSGSSSHQGVEQGGSSYSHENSYKVLEQQPTYTSNAGPSSHENIGHNEISEKGQHSFNTQRPSGSSSQQEHSGYEQQQESYKAEIKQQPKYTSVVKGISYIQAPQSYGLATHQALGSSNYVYFGEGKQNYKAQQPSSQSIVHQTQAQSGSSSQTSADRGSYEGSSHPHQPTRLTHGGSSIHVQQVNFGGHSGYESKANSISKSGKKKAEGQESKGWQQ